MLTVLGVSEDVYIDPKRGWKYKKWDCLCDCGNITSVRTNDLKSGKSKSCGCTHRELLIQRNYVHGKSGTRLYAVWIKIKDRCLNPRCKRYSDYGGRGITICEEWKNSYESFENWALSNGYDVNAPRGKCTVDRIDNDGDYCPENCRIVDFSVQANNSRNCNYITYNGETHTASEWEKITRIKAATLRCRLFRYNWTVEEAFTIPVGLCANYKGRKNYYGASA